MSHNPPDNLKNTVEKMLDQGYDPVYVQAYMEYWCGKKENLRKNYPDLFRHFEAPADLQAMHMRMVLERQNRTGQELAGVLAQEEPAAYDNYDTNITTYPDTNTDTDTSTETNTETSTETNTETKKETMTDSASVPDTKKRRKERPVFDQFAKYYEQMDAEEEMIEKGTIREDLSEIRSRYSKNNQVLCGFIILATEYYGFLREFDVSKTGKRRKMTIQQKRNFYKKRYKMKTISQIRSRREKCIEAALEVLECMNKDELILKGKVVFK